MKTYSHQTIIEPAEEGGYTAYVPKLPGCVSEGETYEETEANMKEALTLYLEVAKERNFARCPPSRLSSSPSLRWTAPKRRGCGK